MRILFSILLLLTLVNCAHRGNLKSDAPDENEISSGDEDADAAAAANEPIPPGPEDEAPIEVGKAMPRAEDISDAETDMMKLPEDFNQNVNMWVEYFQGKGRKHMVKYLGRSTRYLPKMKEIFKSHGLPEDLVYIALIESGFSHKAYSRARASGYWQFIRGTARRYDLRIDYYTDERSDYIKSTEAAAQYLKALYHLFGSWYLAIASYNVGENRVKSLVMKHSTRDFWELARKRKLPKETIHYVPKFLAARLIGKHPEKYGFKKEDIEYMAPLDFQEVKYDKAVSMVTLAPQLGMDYEELHFLNPAFKKGIIPKYDSDVVVRVPSSLNKDQVLAAINNSATDIAVAQTVIDLEEKEFTKYRVRSGDTLSTIARKFRTSIGALIEVNDLSRRAVLKVGRSLRIPKGARSVSSDRKSKGSSTNYQPAKAQKQAIVKLIKLDLKRKAVKQKFHIVKGGESLLNIANRYNVRLSRLIAANKLRQSEKILIGSRLVIPH